jgi:hypothetical protein
LPDGHVYTTNVIATDDAGGQSTMSFTWDITHFVPPPEFDSVPDTQTTAAGTSVNSQDVSVLADSPDGNNVTFSLSGQPSGLSIDANTGEFSGTLASGAAGVYDVVVTATNSGSTTATTTADFHWIVTSGNSGPAMTNPGTQTFAEGDSVDLTIHPTTSNTDTPAYFQMSGQPSGIEIDPQTGEITGNLDYTTAEAQTNGDYPTTVTVTDAAGGQTAVNFNLHVNHVDAVPVITNPGAQSAAIGDSVDIPLTVNFPNGQPDYDDLNFTITGLPAGLGYDPSSGEITGTVGDSAVTSTVSISVQDGDNGLSSAQSQSFTMTIAPVTNTVTLTGGLELGAAFKQAVTLNVATFTSTDPSATADSFTAQIDWSDGLGYQSATVTGPQNGLFQVQGTHTYANNQDLLQHTYYLSVKVTTKSNGVLVTGSNISSVWTGALMAGTLDPNSFYMGSYSTTAFADADPTGFQVSGAVGPDDTTVHTTSEEEGTSNEWDIIGDNYEIDHDSYGESGGSANPYLLTITDGDHNSTTIGNEDGIGCGISVAAPPITVVGEAIPANAPAGTQIASFSLAMSAPAYNLGDFTPSVTLPDGTPVSVRVSGKNGGPFGIYLTSALNNTGGDLRDLNIGVRESGKVSGMAAVQQAATDFTVVDKRIRDTGVISALDLAVDNPPVGPPYTPYANLVAPNLVKSNDYLKGKNIKFKYTNNNVTSLGLGPTNLKPIQKDGNAIRAFNTLALTYEWDVAGPMPANLRIRFKETQFNWVSTPIEEGWVKPKMNSQNLLNADPTTIVIASQFAASFNIDPNNNKNATKRIISMDIPGLLGASAIQSSLTVTVLDYWLESSGKVGFIWKKVPGSEIIQNIYYATGGVAEGYGYVGWLDGLRPDLKKLASTPLPTK